jgi:hypothetical protein
MLSFFGIGNPGLKSDPDGSGANPHSLSSAGVPGVDRDRKIAGPGRCVFARVECCEMRLGVWRFFYRHLQHAFKWLNGWMVKRVKRVKRLKG